MKKIFWTGGLVCLMTISLYGQSKGLGLRVSGGLSDFSMSEWRNFWTNINLAQNHTLPQYTRDRSNLYGGITTYYGITKNHFISLDSTLRALSTSLAMDF